jgi:negative regulator of replication initiation
VNNAMKVFVLLFTICAPLVALAKSASPVFPSPIQMQVLHVYVASKPKPASLEVMVGQLIVKLNKISLSYALLSSQKQDEARREIKRFVALISTLRRVTDQEVSDEKVLDLYGAYVFYQATITK